MPVHTAQNDDPTTTIEFDIPPPPNITRVYEQPGWFSGPPINVFDYKPHTSESFFNRILCPRPHQDQTKKSGKVNLMSSPSP